MSEQAQKSEVHATTGDADTSPTSEPRRESPGTVGGAAESAKSSPDAGGGAADNHGELKGTHVVEDESDAGGPIKIEAPKVPNPAI